jgi:hypothetical protein
MHATGKTVSITNGNHNGAFDSGVGLVVTLLIITRGIRFIWPVNTFFQMLAFFSHAAEAWTVQLTVRIFFPKFFIIVFYLFGVILFLAMYIENNFILDF